MSILNRLSQAKENFAQIYEYWNDIVKYGIKKSLTSTAWSGENEESKYWYSDIQYFFADWYNIFRNCYFNAFDRQYKFAKFL